ncbi:hypothetical protein BDC45DRAFT_568863 [Circinella umbellata]|nr:hypothetical protein BDC45DRAFT_568863 [Circinella umbellata]
MTLHKANNNIDLNTIASSSTNTNNNNSTPTAHSNNINTVDPSSSSSSSLPTLKTRVTENDNKCCGNVLQRLPNYTKKTSIT